MHTILESIFRIVRTERQKYAQSTTKHSQSTSSSRLKNAASALQIVVKAVGDRLKQKTASAVLDHIIDILPQSDGGFCSPVQMEYLKSLNVLLSHGPRSEHFRPKQWQSYVDFLLKHLNSGMSNGADNEATSTSFGQSTSTRNTTSMSVRLSQSSTTRSQQKSQHANYEDLAMEGMLTALKYMTAISNAPILTRIGEIFDNVIHWLERMKRSEQTALEILNDVLPTALSEDIALAAGTFDMVCRIVRQRGLWSKKFMMLRPSILAMMILCHGLLLNTTQSPPLIPLSSLESLLDLMRTEYESMTRSEFEITTERERLQIEDIGFSQPTSRTWFSLGGIELVSEAQRVNNTWFTLCIMACLARGIALKRNIIEHTDNDEGVHKRRKLLNNLNELFSAATSTDSPNQLVSLQLALFIIDQEKTLSETMVTYLSEIQFTELEDEPVIASWICLVFARYLTPVLELID